MDDILLSIVICTRNRAKLLDVCVDSIISQTFDYDNIEIIVVDNASTDETKQVVLSYNTNQLIYVFEKNIGLSVARNSGAVRSRGKWICYIDDDAKAHSDFIEKTLLVINENQFHCFGGVYYGYYPFGKPRWIDSNYGNKVLLRESVGSIDVPELSGGVFFILNELFKLVGGFSLDYGMSGSKIGYGEESIMQKKLLEKGYKLGFVPEIKIDHAVLPHKLKLTWHLKSGYAQGKYQQMVKKDKTLSMSILLLLRSCCVVIIKLPVNIGKILFKKEYYWQNMILDVFRPIYYRIGQIRGILDIRFSE